MRTNKANADLREYSIKRNVPQWRIAKELHIAETTLCRWMRDELTEDKKMEIRKIVDSVAESKVV